MTDFTDTYCTSCKIWYLRLLRPGDTVPFKKPPYILPLGVCIMMIASLIIVLDALAIYCQTQNMTSPSPSFLGNPGFSIWLSILFLICGGTQISAYKKKTRFSSAVCFGFSVIGTVFVMILLAIMTMAVSEELNYFHRTSNATGVVISIIICVLVLTLFALLSLSSLLCYVALTSHDDRWFTDRGTQHEPPNVIANPHNVAKLSVPSGQPAFLFYAPSVEASKYTSAFGDVMKGMEVKNNKTKRNIHEEDYDISDRTKTADTSGNDSPLPATPSSFNQPPLNLSTI